MSRLSRILGEPELRTIDIESADRITAHLRILERKRTIREVFEEFYHHSMELDRRYFEKTPGLQVELGAGVSKFGKLYPELVVTDIAPAPHLDVVVDAQQMPFADGSVRTLFGMNCFHHFPEPTRFLDEALRVLHPGGGCVLIEPWDGPVSGMIHKRLFASEIFDKSEPEWSSADRQVMQGANQALSHIVFVRDRAKYEALYPDLEIVHREPLPNYLRYLLSGGLNFRQLSPDAFIGLLKFCETCLGPVQKLTALHYVIVLRKRAQA